MPGNCMYAKGGGCACRDDRAPVCTLFRIASATTRSQTIEDVKRSPDEIQARKRVILENMGY